MVKRSGPPKRTTRIRPANGKRQRREFARAYGSPARVQFVQSLPCVCPACPHPSENAHVGPKGKGAGRKADADQIAPLCHGHHQFLHQHGPLLFAATFGVSPRMLLDAAEATDAAWRAHTGAP